MGMWGGTEWSGGGGEIQIYRYRRCVHILHTCTCTRVHAQACRTAEHICRLSKGLVLLSTNYHDYVHTICLHYVRCLPAEDMQVLHLLRFICIAALAAARPAPHRLMASAHDTCIMSCMKLLWQQHPRIHERP